MAMLEIRDLEVNYGAINAIKKISFDVNEGEVIALIGANGAGKTTTLHTITGLHKARAGSVMFMGKDILKLPPHKIVQMGMAHVPEGRRIFQQLSCTRTSRWAPLRARTRRAWRNRWPGCTRDFRVWKKESARSPALCPAASSRCWPWGGR